MANNRSVRFIGANLSFIPISPERYFLSWKRYQEIKAISSMFHENASISGFAMDGSRKLEEGNRMNGLPRTQKDQQTRFSWDVGGHDPVFLGWWCLLSQILRSHHRFAFEGISSLQ
jgi:hypothetical protein